MFAFNSTRRTQKALNQNKPDMLVGRLDGAAEIDKPCCQGPVDPGIAVPQRQGGIATAWFGAVVCSSIGFWIPVQGRLCCKWGAMVFWGLESRASPIPFIDVDA